MFRLRGTFKAMLGIKSIRDRSILIRHLCLDDSVVVIQKNHSHHLKHIKFPRSVGEFKLVKKTCLNSYCKNYEQNNMDNVKTLHIKYINNLQIK